MASKSDPPKTKGIQVYKSKIFWAIFILSGLILYFKACAPESCSGSSGSTQIPTSQNQQRTDRQSTKKSLPASNELPLYFDGKKSVTVKLKTDSWSRQVITPPSDGNHLVDYRIDVEPRNGYFLLFADGGLEEVSAQGTEFKDFGMRRGIFRILGNSNDQAATITIYYRKTP